MVASCDRRCGDRAQARRRDTCPGRSGKFWQHSCVERSDDIRLTFNRVADIYDRVRPSYPANMFDELFEMLPPQPTIVEVGPGTGQATKDLLARGAVVLAIEIGAAMATTLRSNLASDRLRIGVGDFERCEIPPGETDAVFSPRPITGSPDWGKLRDPRKF